MSYDMVYKWIQTSFVIKEKKMGDYSKGKPIGKHVILKVNGEIDTKQ